MEGSTKKTVIRPTSSIKKKTDNSPDGTQSRPRMSANQEPTYYIGGGNGNAIVEQAMNGMGWRRIKDKTDDSVRLRWCEVKSGINYSAFREGEQMVNRIPNGNLLTNKLGLLNSLQEHCRISNTIQKRPVQLDFLPETYRLDDPKDRETFNEIFKENDIWICKPTGRNQGKGIFLVRNLDDLNQTSGENDEANQQSQQSSGKPRKPLNRIIQRYIMNPLLLDGRKFDIRCYMLLASTAPLLVFYHRGYIRLSMYDYDNSCENIIAHLTNQFIQKRDPQYDALKEETAWSMDKFNDYINEKIAPDKGLEKDWTYGYLTKTIKRIMVQCINAVKNKLQCRLGYFDMFGFDFMIDEDMKVWLIEVNVNPCLAINCEALRERVPGVIRETLSLSIECFEKGRRNRPLLPLQSLKEFELIYDGGAGKASSSSPTRGTRQSPLRRARSMSPVKESTALSTRDANKTRRSAGSSTVVPKATSTSSDASVAKKSTKSVLTGVGDADEPNISKNSPETVFKQPKRNKTSMEGEDSNKSSQNTEISTERRKPPTPKSAFPLLSDSRNKIVPYLARPGVAKQSTSNTMRDSQTRKKKTTVDGVVDSSENDKTNRGS